MRSATLGMLDHVGGMTDDAWKDQLAVWQFHVLPDFPLVLVADVADLKRIGMRVDRQHHLDDVAHGDVGRVRTVPTAPAQMKPDAVRRQVADRVVQRLDAEHGELLIIVQGGLGFDHVPVLGERRVVKLQDEARVDDRFVCLAHRVGAGEQQFLLGFVVFVGDA